MRSYIHSLLGSSSVSCAKTKSQGQRSARVSNNIDSCILQSFAAVRFESERRGSDVEMRESCQVSDAASQT